MHEIKKIKHYTKYTMWFYKSPVSRSVEFRFKSIVNWSRLKLSKRLKHVSCKGYGPYILGCTRYNIHRFVWKMKNFNWLWIWDGVIRAFEGWICSEVATNKTENELVNQDNVPCYKSFVKLHKLCFEFFPHTSYTLNS